LRRITALILILSALSAAGCKRRHRPNPNATIEEESELSSTVSVADPRDSAQLLGGFYNLEQNAWRWTAKQFSVSLATPMGAAQRGARLEVQFTVPHIVAADLAGVSIAATIGGTKLPPFRATKTGEQVASFDVPAGALQAEAVIAEFDLDKTVPVRDGETRVLGVIVSRFALVGR